MASLLNTIVGCIVSDAKQVHDYVQITFSNKIGLSIYNKICVDQGLKPLSKLNGKMVTSIAEEAISIRINFIDHTQICIDMRPEAYRGPEALQLNRPGEPPVIWN